MTCSPGVPDTCPTISTPGVPPSPPTPPLTATTCTANQYASWVSIPVLDPLTKKIAYNKTDRACFNCSLIDNDCAYCNATQCLMCRQNFYYNKKGSYIYTPSGSIIPGRRNDDCVFDNCEAGMCRNIDNNTCISANSRLQNCLRCNMTFGD
jgi:hypothetical protein